MPIRIALVSDTHLSPRAAAFNANWQKTVAWLRGAAPDWLIHLGDVCADAETHRAELAFARGCLAAAGLPMRVLPGNHDIGDVPDHAALAAYRRAFGEDDWALEIGAWRLIGLNAQLLGQAGAAAAAQTAWLDAVLAAPPRPLGLLLHKPLLRHGDGVEDRYVPQTAGTALLARLRRCGLRFVASGHVHQRRTFERDGVVHQWIPSTAFCIPDAVQAPLGRKEVGITRLLLDGEDFSFEDGAVPGLVRHNLVDFDEVYPPLAALRARLGAAARLSDPED